MNLNTDQQDRQEKFEYEILSIETLDGDVEKASSTAPWSSSSSSSRSCRRRHLETPKRRSTKPKTTTVLERSSFVPGDDHGNDGATVVGGEDSIIIDYGGPGDGLMEDHYISRKTWSPTHHSTTTNINTNNAGQTDDDTSTEEDDTDETTGSSQEDITQNANQPIQPKPDELNNNNNSNDNGSIITNNNNDNNDSPDKFDLLVNVTIKKKSTTNSSKSPPECTPDSKKNSLSKMYQNPSLLLLRFGSRKALFLLILVLSILALVLLHNGSLHTRKTPNPSKIFPSNHPFIVEFEFGQLKELWSKLSQNEISFTMFYAPWDSDSLRARNEIEIVANHYGQQIFFAAINCWWPDGECRKYQQIKRFPQFVAYIRTEGEIEYKGPVLASYIIPFLDNVMTPLIPVQNEGELLDLRAQHDAVILGYFDFLHSPHQPGYRSYLATAIKALAQDPWRDVVFTVCTNPRTATKLKIDPQKDSTLTIYVGNTTDQFTVKSWKTVTLLSWIYSRAELATTIKWMNPSGVKSTLIADFIKQQPTFILFTPRSFLLGISPYYDLLREIVLDYYNCDRSPVIRSLIHRNILRRRLLEERLSELEERCHELLDNKDLTSSGDQERTKKYNDNIDICCHSQPVKWRSFGGVRHGMTKKCLCTSCVHISLPKCPSKCAHFDCLSTASRYLDEFDPNYVNNSAVYCNQIKSTYQPRYTPYYKVVTSCSGNLQETPYDETGVFPGGVNRQNTLTTDEKISRMIQEFETQHCRRLKLGMNYTDLNFPESTESRNRHFRANFTGLACRTNRTLKFMAFDSLLYQAFAESLGIDVFNVPHTTVALIIDPTRETVHVLNHDIHFEEVEMTTGDSKTTIHVPINSYSKNSFLQFIKNFTDGKLPRFLRNQMTSSSGICDLKQLILQDAMNRSNTNVICVPELNSISFVDFVLGRSLSNRNGILEKDIVVMYYAPWCGFCSSIAHVFLDIARIFTFSNNIIFARINGDANDLPWEYTVDRYPTIIFFPAQKRSNSVAYPADKPVDQTGLFRFILKYAQPSIKIQMAVILCEDQCLKRSYISNYFQRIRTIRTIGHYLKSLLITKDKLREISSTVPSKSKELKRLTERQTLTKQYLDHVQKTLRQRQSERNRQILLSQFLLLKIDSVSRGNPTGYHGEKLAGLLQDTTQRKKIKSTAKQRTTKAKGSDQMKSTKKKQKSIKDEL